MRFLVLPFGQAVPTANAGIGELVAYQLEIDQIAEDQVWEIEGRVEPSLLSPDHVRLTGVGPKSDRVTFEAIESGRATIRFWAKAAGDAHPAVLHVKVA